MKILVSIVLLSTLLGGEAILGREAYAETGSGTRGGGEIVFADGRWRFLDPLVNSNIRCEEGADVIAQNQEFSDYMHAFARVNAYSQLLFEEEAKKLVFCFVDNDLVEVETRDSCSPFRTPRIPGRRILGMRRLDSRFVMVDETLFNNLKQSSADDVALFMIHETARSFIDYPSEGNCQNNADVRNFTNLIARTKTDRSLGAEQFQLILNSLHVHLPERRPVLNAVIAEVEKILNTELAVRARMTAAMNILEANAGSLLVQHHQTILLNLMGTTTRPTTDRQRVDISQRGMTRALSNSDVSLFLLLASEFRETTDINTYNQSILGLRANIESEDFNVLALSMKLKNRELLNFYETTVRDISSDFNRYDWFGRPSTQVMHLLHAVQESGRLEDALFVLSSSLIDDHRIYYSLDGTGRNNNLTPIYDIVKRHYGHAGIFERVQNSSIKGVSKSYIFRRVIAENDSAAIERIIEMSKNETSLIDQVKESALFAIRNNNIPLLDKILGHRSFDPNAKSLIGESLIKYASFYCDGCVSVMRRRFSNLTIEEVIDRSSAYLNAREAFYTSVQRGYGRYEECKENQDKVTNRAGENFSIARLVDIESCHIQLLPNIIMSIKSLRATKRRADQWTVGTKLQQGQALNGEWIPLTNLRLAAKRMARAHNSNVIFGALNRDETSVEEDYDLLAEDFVSYIENVRRSYIRTYIHPSGTRVAAYNFASQADVVKVVNKAKK